MIATIGSSQRLGSRAATEARGVSTAEGARLIKADVLLDPGAVVALPIAFDPDHLLLWRSWAQDQVGIASGTPATNEIHRLTPSGTPPSAGDVRIGYAAGNTGAIAWNASASAVATAYEAASWIGPGDVAVTGGPFPGGTFDVEFTGALAGTDVNNWSGTNVYAFSWGPGLVGVTVVQSASAGSILDQWTEQPGPGRCWTRELIAIDPCPFTAPVPQLVLTNPSGSRQTLVRLRALLSPGG